ncbi:MAG: DNA translocase FtsK 4TM domain-containing protein [bacterium]
MDSLRHRLIHEIFGVLFFSLALFIFLSLVTYSPKDPSYFTLTKGGAIHNFAGRFGAGLAALLLVGLGAPAFLLPLFLGIAGWGRITRQEMKPSFIQSLGGALFFPSVCGLLALSVHRKMFGDILPGGVLGEVVKQIAFYFGVLGTYIVLLALLSVSLILLTRYRMTTEEPEEEGFFLAKKRNKDKKSPAKPSRKSKKQQNRVPVPENDPDKEIFACSKGVLPPMSLLEQSGKRDSSENKQWIQESSRKLEEKLQDFAVQGKVTQVLPGPVVTRYEYEPAPGIKISKIANLADDLALAMKALSVRIVAPVPGKSVVGLEIPNQQREVVYLREILESEQFARANSKLSLALGKDIAGIPYITDLARMPHLLIAGATGSGKSVAINALICSILFNATADEVKFIMIDPKMLELGIYNDIPHLLSPVVVDPKEAASALRWATQEMENRYRIMAQKGVRNISQYNQLISSEAEAGSSTGSGDPPPWEGSKDDMPGALGEADQEELKQGPLPYIVIVIDEFADLMIMAAREVETLLIRLAQMARAVGIHLIIATQRPSVDVVTGLIKANFPSRISFRVSSKTDSRTILDTNGAEKLLGQGDMLFLPPASSELVRLHGSSITEVEIKRLVKYLSSQGKPEYDESILTFTAAEGKPGSKQDEEEYDDLYDKAVDLVIKTRQASISMIQRRLRIGYNRAARMIELMERDGVVSKPQGSKPREVLIGSDYEK